MQRRLPLWHHAEHADHADYVKVRTEAAVCRMHNALGLKQDGRPTEEDDHENDAGRIPERATGA
jgi:hypothetical protein